MIYAKAKKTIMKVSRNSFAASLAFGTFNPPTREIDALYGFFSCFPEKIPERAFIKSIDREVSVKKERKEEEKRVILTLQSLCQKKAFPLIPGIMVSVFCFVFDFYEGWTVRKVIGVGNFRAT